MSYVMVDIEADGPIPGDYSMVCFGAVIVEPGLNRTFYGKLKPISEQWVPQALAVSGFTRDEVLGFDDPRAVMEQFRSWLGENEEVQLDVWKGTGGIPAVTRVQQRLAKEDPLFLQVKTVLIDAPYHITPAYYFKQWPEVHATFSDYATKALTGKREDIGKTLAEGGQKLSEIMRR